MIGLLRGTLSHVSADGVIVDVRGVGYEIAMSARAIGDLGSMGTEVTVFTHTYVREDAIALYGFPTPADRQLFRILLGASGVGPKVALAVLGAMTADEVRGAVANDDVDALTVVPGIGKRTAQKMILELRPKLAATDSEVVGGATATGQVRLALEGLGFTGAEISEVLQAVDRTAPVAEQIRQALRQRGRAS